MIDDKTRIYTLREAAQVLHCNPAVLRRRIKAGKINCFKDGSWIKFTNTDIDEYIEKNRVRK